MWYKRNWRWFISSASRASVGKEVDHIHRFISYVPYDAQLKRKKKRKNKYEPASSGEEEVASWRRQVGVKKSNKPTKGTVMITPTTERALYTSR